MKNQSLSAQCRYDFSSFLRQARQGKGAFGQRQERAAAFLSGGASPFVSEAWKYTDMRSLAGVVFQPLAGGGGTEGHPAAFYRERFYRKHPALSGLPCLVLVNGVCLAAQSAGVCDVQLCHDGVVALLEEDRPNPSAALNDLLVREEALISVPAGVDAGVLVILHVVEGGGQAVSAHGRCKVCVGRGGRLSLIEVYGGGSGHYLHNPATLVHVAEEGALRHLRLQDEALEGAHLSVTHACLERRSVYESFGLFLGAGLNRHDISACLSGEGAAIHANAVQISGGRRHSDITSFIAHEAPSCVSKQTVKTILADRGSGVFQGKILVERGAQKTDGYQMNQALLLSDHAEMNTKPELEIYADDVRCSHGATVGALDKDQLFYLQARGIERGEARSMLVQAFIEDAFYLISDERLRRVVMEMPLQREGETS